MPTSGHKMLKSSTYGITGDKITRILANAPISLIRTFDGHMAENLNYPISGDELARIKAQKRIDFLTYCKDMRFYISPKEKMELARLQIARVHEQYKF